MSLYFSRVSSFSLVRLHVYRVNEYRNYDLHGTNMSKYMLPSARSDVVFCIAPGRDPSVVIKGCVVSVMTVSTKEISNLMKYCLVNLFQVW